MNRSEKANLLINRAKAYLARGKWVQYDQLSLDRIVRCSARRNAFAPPEAAAEGRYLFLDCAAFVWACYFQTFDCRLEADMVINMIDHLSARVFYYELTHEEDAQQIDAVRRAFCSCLQPGDIISYERTFRAAHTVLYIGNGQFIHCTQEHGFNGYNYEERRNVFDPEGGLRIDDLKVLTEDTSGKRYLFADTIKRFSVNRPLDILGDPTDQTLIRFEKARDLYCSVYSSIGYGHTASRGEKVSYDVEVKNLGNKICHAEINVEPGAGTELCGPNRQTKVLLPGESYKKQFNIQCGFQDGLMENPVVKVNDLSIYVPDVVVGPRPDNTGVDSQNILETTSCSELLHRLFFLHDTAAGDVLSRRQPCPSEDMNVFGLYGGFGVITPQIAAGEEVRTVYIDRKCLEPGDIILCADDALLEHCYTVHWDGEKLSGSFEFDGVPSCKKSGEADRWIDSLFGRFCFAVIRPSLSKKYRR